MPRAKAYNMVVVPGVTLHDRLAQIPPILGCAAGSARTTDDQIERSVCVLLSPCVKRERTINGAALLIVVLIIAVLFFAGSVLFWQTRKTAQQEQEVRVVEADRSDEESKQILLQAKEEALRMQTAAEQEVRERRAELVRREQRLTQREETLDRRRREHEANEAKLKIKEERLDALEEQLKTQDLQLQAELERVSSLSVEDARDELFHKLEGELSAEIAERIHAADVRVREEVQERSREILVTAMQRYASDQAGEASVTVVHLPSDEMKGRIIGKEGRNIRALESATGVDIIVDETPEVIVLSAFDPVRREVAKMSLERLFSDGRIHPARIEDVVAKSRNEIQQRIREEGELACHEIGIENLHPELVKLLGTLAFRTAYGQNVLQHSKETAAIAGMIAAEVGYDEQEAREIGLFHDIGMAAEHDIDGSHAVIGSEILARIGRPSRVVHAVRAHHYDEEPRTIGAYILMAADAISATRKGGRRETLDTLIKRFERIESIANGFDGVEQSFAVQSGRELHVMVRPEEVSDDQAVALAHKIAKRIHGSATYNGQIKVVVLRETRSVEYAT